MCERREKEVAEKKAKGEKRRKLPLKQTCCVTRLAQLEQRQNRQTSTQHQRYNRRCLLAGTYASGMKEEVGSRTWQRPSVHSLATHSKRQPLSAS